MVVRESAECRIAQSPPALLRRRCLSVRGSSRVSAEPIVPLIRQNKQTSFGRRSAEEKAGMRTLKIAIVGLLGAPVVAMALAGSPAQSASGASAVLKDTSG